MATQMNAMPEQADPMAGGYCIELYKMPDGTFMVAKSEKQIDPAMIDGEPARNIGEAMMLVEKMAVSPEDTQTREAEQAGFDAVFAPKAKPRPSMPELM